MKQNTMQNRYLSALLEQCKQWILEISASSDKTVASQETISDHTLLCTINDNTKKLGSNIADPKSERSLSERTLKRVSRGIELISKHNTCLSGNSEDVFSTALIKRVSLKQSNFVVGVNQLGLINLLFTTDDETF